MAHNITLGANTRPINQNTIKMLLNEKPVTVIITERNGEGGEKNV